MGRWNGVGNGNYFGPEIDTYELINERDNGHTYKEMDYVLIDDIPDKYIEEFQQWINENQLEICVCRKECIENGCTTCEEIKAVDYSYWWHWFRVYGRKI